MSRCVVICEGPTELKFINKCLKEHVENIELHPVLLGECQGQDCGGGGVTYARFKKDFYPAANGYEYVTTFFDYYGLGNDWPKLDSLKSVSRREKVRALEAKIFDQIKVDFPELAKQFIPFLALHEFEALLYSDTDAMAAVLRREKVLFDAALDECDEPEFINDGPETAPSKRIGHICEGGYRKTVKGMRIARRIPISTMAEKCPHFNSWLQKLKAL